LPDGEDVIATGTAAPEAGWNCNVSITVLAERVVITDCATSGPRPFPKGPG
jgi:hypothetical protein